MPSPQTRKQRLEEILKLVKKFKQVNVKGLFGEMSLKYGVSKRTFDEYLAALINAGKIIYDEEKDVITLVEEEK